jgi:hypothetical protein
VIIVRPALFIHGAGTEVCRTLFRSVTEKGRVKLMGVVSRPWTMRAALYNNRPIETGAMPLSRIKHGASPALESHWTRLVPNFNH